jgi:uncharacterized protein YdeI (BOF family)
VRRNQKQMPDHSNCNSVSDMIRETTLRRNAMKQPMTHFALAALLATGVVGCATDSPRSIETAPIQPVVQSQPQLIEGQVVRNEADAYLIREATGRETRVRLDRNTMSDRIAVGDNVVVRFDGPPSSPYASSITRRTTNPLPPLVSNPLPPSVNTLPRPQTVEGIVQRQDGSDYVIKDLSGREVRLRVDNTTRLDGNIAAGDRVVVVTSGMASDLPYATSVYRLGNPDVVQGDVVSTDANGYVVRDLTGREVRINTNSTTNRDSNIVVGDRIIAYTGRSSVVHADSIAKR